jgi:hypothetical protein
MKKVLFLLIVLFSLSATIEANAANAAPSYDPPKGYNYKREYAKQARYFFFFKKRIHRQNGGCGWAKNH